MGGDSEDRAVDRSTGTEAEIDPVRARLDGIRHDLDLARIDREETLTRARLLADAGDRGESPAEPPST